MDQQLEAPHPNGAVKINQKPRRRTVWRRLGIALLIVVAAVWGYAIWYSVSRGSPEDLDDSARDAIASACADARSALVALPDLPDEPTAEQDVKLVGQENAILTSMVGRIEEIDTSGDDAAQALDKWVADWRRLIDARAAFATDLAADGTARLEVPAVSSGSVQPITDRMDEYANGRGLEDCRPEPLQAEVVDGPRDYTVEEN